MNTTTTKRCLTPLPAPGSGRAAVLALFQKERLVSVKGPLASSRDFLLAVIRFKINCPLMSVSLQVLVVLK